jgi:hypothetical protein
MINDNEVSQKLLMRYSKVGRPKSFINYSRYSAPSNRRLASYLNHDIRNYVTPMRLAIPGI